MLQTEEKRVVLNNLVLLETFRAKAIQSPASLFPCSSEHFALDWLHSLRSSPCGLEGYLPAWQNLKVATMTAGALSPFFLVLFRFWFGFFQCML